MAHIQDINPESDNFYESEEDEEDEDDEYETFPLEEEHKERRESFSMNCHHDSCEICFKCIRTSQE